MRRQLPCSKCGFAHSSTWRSLNSSTLVICNACRTSKVVIDPNPPNQAVNNINLSRNLSLDQISPSSSIMQENVAISISQIGMIFGNLPFEPTLAFPLIANGKSEVFTAEDNCAVAAGTENHFYSGKSSTTSVFGDGIGSIQITQEYDYEEALSSQAEHQQIWETNKVRKKKRSKLPQYTLSPLARFINHLQHVSCYGRCPYDKSKNAAATAEDMKDQPKYDDVLIYEKCKFVGENEVGLGAKLLSPPLTRSIVMIKEEFSSTNECW